MSDQDRPRVIMVEGSPWVAHEFHQRCLDELRTESERLREAHAEAVALAVRYRDELDQTRDVARRVLALRSSYDADRGIDSKLVNNLQAREMLERISGPIDAVAA